MPDIAYSLCQECVRFLEKPDNYSVMTQGEKNQMLDWKNTWPSFMWDLLSSPRNFEEDAKTIMKYKEVLSALENATDMCEDVANVLETILVKNA